MSNLNDETSGSQRHRNSASVTKPINRTIELPGIVGVGLDLNSYVSYNQCSCSFMYYTFLSEANYTVCLLCMFIDVKYVL